MIVLKVSLKVELPDSKQRFAILGIGVTYVTVCTSRVLVFSRKMKCALLAETCVEGGFMRELMSWVLCRVTGDRSSVKIGPLEYNYIQLQVISYDIRSRRPLRDVGYAVQTWSSSISKENVVSTYISKPTL